MGVFIWVVLSGEMWVIIHSHYDGFYCRYIKFLSYGFYYRQHTHQFEITRVYFNKHNFVIGLRKLPFFVLTSTTRTILSSPGWSLTTRASSHFPRGTSFSTSNAKSPISMFISELCHFGRVEIVGRYSRSHLLQNWFVSAYALFHLLLWFTSSW